MFIFRELPEKSLKSPKRPSLKAAISGQGYRSLVCMPDPGDHPGPDGELVNWSFVDGQRASFRKRVEGLLGRVTPLPTLQQYLNSPPGNRDFAFYRDLYEFCENVVRPKLAQPGRHQAKIIQAITQSSLYQESAKTYPSRIGDAWNCKGPLKHYPQLDDAAILFAQYVDRRLKTLVATP